MPVRKRGPQNQLCRDALPRPAGPAALPPKTVLDGSAALVATVPYGCGPRTAPRDAPPPFRPASRCVTGSAVNPSSLAVRCRPGQCPNRPRPLGPGIDGRFRCARSSKPHPLQQSHERRALPNVVRISRGADTTARARFLKRPGLDRARADLKARRRRLHALVIRPMPGHVT